MKLLIAPLDWGLGHAARCVPLIRYLLEKNCEVVIGAEGRPLKFLQKEFPALEFIRIPGYDISYPRNGFMALKIALQIPKILCRVKQEHELLEKIIKDKEIDAVVSDNRFGLWSRRVPCVFITHQIGVKSPFGEKLIQWINKKYISKYAECWVPDQSSSFQSSSAGEGLENCLSGDLSHTFPLPANAKFIGLLTRFEPFVCSFKERSIYRMLVLLSGPEPQRTVWENKIIQQLKINFTVSPDELSLSKNRVLIVQGITEKDERKMLSGNIEIVSHLTSEELQHKICSSEIILSRPGYSTIMDLAVLGKKVIFVPTPGQTEQEYLAEYFSKKKIAYSVRQNKFNLYVALKESEKFTGFKNRYSAKEFETSMDLFLSKVATSVRHACAIQKRPLEIV